MFKNQLVKRIAIIGAVVIGIFAFGGATQANASSIPTFYKRTITYHIDCTSSHYKDIWKDAFKVWNSKGVLRFKPTSKKKAMLRVTTRKTLSEDALWWSKGTSNFNLLKLNRSIMDNYNTTRKQRVNLATWAIWIGLGCDGKKAYSSAVWTPISSTEVATVKKTYAHIK